MRISDWISDVCSSDLPDFLGIVLDRAADDAGHVLIALHELRHPLEHAQHVVGDQHLTVALGRGADADRRAFDLFGDLDRDRFERSEEHTSELQSLMRSSYAVFCLKKKNTHKRIT